MHQHLNYRVLRRRGEKERVWENFWRDYSWKFPNIEKRIVNEVQEAQRIPYRIKPRRNMPRHKLIKMTKTQQKERIWKAASEKQQVIHKGNPTCLTACFSVETLQAAREWQDIFRVLKWKNLNQDYCTWQGSHSKLMEKSKTFQTSKHLENSVPPNQFYNKC